MPLTNAEKQKRYRERIKLQEPEKHDFIKRKDKERAKRNRNKKARNKENVVQDECILQENNKQHEETNKEKEKKEYISMSRRIHRQNMKLNEDVTKVNKKIKSLQRQLNRYKRKTKVLEDTINQYKKEESVPSSTTELPTSNIQNATNEMTPQTKTNLFIAENLTNVPETEKEKVKKQIFESNVLIHTLKQKFDTASVKEKITIKSVFESDGVKKHRLRSKFAGYLGLKDRIRQSSHSIKKRRASLLNSLLNFYMRDDVSRATAGKKEVKTFKKEKRQRRYLLHPLKLLYEKYRSENGRLSYSTFKKYRPFFILSPRLSNRDTCACIRHENMVMKFQKLKSLNLNTTDTIEELLQSITCGPNKDCAYNKCDTCKDKTVNFEIDERNMNIVAWKEWSMESTEYKDKKGDMKRVKRMLKKDVTGTLRSLVNKFNDKLIKFKKHCFNIAHQYKMYQTCIKTLDEESVAVHVDFSENYTCKLATEVQSMHFGASKVQITLHTGVMYCKDRGPLSFATISSNNFHGPEAIWAHLHPILNLIKEDFPKVKTIHFFSDGPATQYKQKKNFYLFEQTTKKLGFTTSTWNFFEASHGKGAADGVGGAVKRTLDSKVAYGQNVTDAESAFSVLNETESKIKFFLVPANSIKQELFEVSAVPATLDIHQIRNTAMKNTVAFRDLSCFCTNSEVIGYCECFGVQQHNLKKPQPIKHKSAPVSHPSDKRKKLNKERWSDDESYCQSDYEEWSDHSSSENETINQGRENILDDSANKKNEKSPVKSIIKPVIRSIGSYVVFKYEEQLYPGVITSTNDEGALISAMEKSVKYRKWPTRKDELLYAWHDVLGHINPPKLISKRGYFSVPELDDFSS